MYIKSYLIDKFLNSSTCDKSMCSMIEAFQGVLATAHIAQKCGDNLFLIHRQPTKTDRKRVTICDSDNPFLLSTKRHVFALLFSTATLLPGDLTCIQVFFYKYREGAYQVYDHRLQVTTPINRRGLFSPLPSSYIPSS